MSAKMKAVAKIVNNGEIWPGKAAKGGKAAKLKSRALASAKKARRKRKARIIVSFNETQWLSMNWAALAKTGGVASAWRYSMKAESSGMAAAKISGG
jgi:hypothetical protein